jgi:hypothetical protein
MEGCGGVSSCWNGVLGNEWFSIPGSCKTTRDYVMLVRGRVAVGQAHAFLLFVCASCRVCVLCVATPRLVQIVCVLCVVFENSPHSTKASALCKINVILQGQLPWLAKAGVNVTSFYKGFCAL